MLTSGQSSCQDLLLLRFSCALALSCVLGALADTQARRRRLLVEQQTARATSESRVEAESLLEVLVRRSGEEQRLGQRLWQLRQEKVRMSSTHTAQQERAALGDCHQQLYALVLQHSYCKSCNRCLLRWSSQFQSAVTWCCNGDAAQCWPLLLLAPAGCHGG